MWNAKLQDSTVISLSYRAVFLDGMNTMSMYGKRMGKGGARQRARWATSDIARYPHGNGSIERA